VPLCLAAADPSAPNSAAAAAAGSAPSAVAAAAPPQAAPPGAAPAKPMRRPMRPVLVAVSWPKLPEIEAVEGYCLCLGSVYGSLTACGILACLPANVDRMVLNRGKSLRITNLFDDLHARTLDSDNYPICWLV